MALRALLALFALGLAPVAAAQSRPPIERVKLPPGFEITLFAEGIRDARSLAPGDKGWLFVSTRTAGNVYAVRHDGKRALETLTIARGLNMPNGVALKDGDLYVAEVSRVWRYPAIEASLPKVPEPVLVYDKYPTDRHHGWKFIRFGPDGWLYVPVGAPCNVCDRESPYATITRLKPDGSAMEVVARGVRNTVGFDWHPVTKDLWFTDNGRDMMGDDVPPDELNHAPRAGMHFGFPHCHGGDVADPDFAKGKACADFTPPAQKFGAHVASLGMRFYTGTLFPLEYRNQVFVAEHGSWNRSKKAGYRVMRARLEGNRVVEHAVFADGFLDKDADRAWGRPVDVQVMADGALLVSDDYAHAIYRIAPKGR
ncbi:MAG TPA: PQQ-dependent sugar dehydrogenase [Usitatibacteraceae bacterium]|nr:PQQ-dependent sugar dehydrogenase [Usitatibacteraceae bacterium]